MSADYSNDHFRGVHCRRCGKPVKVPALVVKHESAAHSHSAVESMEYHLVSQVFVLRCRSCRRESVYSINQIEDFTFVPTPGSDLAKHAAA